VTGRRSLFVRGTALNSTAIIATALATMAITAITIIAIMIALTPGPPPPAPNGLGPDGLYPVTAPRDTTDIDPCALLRPTEIDNLLGPGATVLDTYDGRCRYISDTGRGRIDVITELHTFDVPDPINAPNTTIAGYPAFAKVPDGYRHCEIGIVLNPEPGRANLGIYWPGQPDCDTVVRVAELVIPHIPLRTE
jgi:hypothetical protein